jgi:hypothetical protein
MQNREECMWETTYYTGVPGGKFNILGGHPVVSVILSKNV